ncbi:LysR family substrate-binding domain-containing protein [Cryobacterium sp. BB736]|uniref:LysR family substrate-binding domain-containing protein n=1 Tax=Cryobacterium sp. BB736 TaxID=2746963 RepID=UPI001874ADD5
MFRIAFVPGVTITKWTRAWEERRRDPLQLLPTLPSDQVAVVHRGEADVAFVRLPIDRDGLSVIRLYTESPVVIAPKDHAFEAADELTVSDLDGENVIEVGEDPKDAVELVAANVGVAVLPQSVARLHARKDVIARPLTDAPGTDIAIVWLADAETPDIEEFVGIVRGRTVRSSRGPGVALPAPQKTKSANASKRPSPKHPSRRRRSR